MTRTTALTPYALALAALAATAPPAAADRDNADWLANAFTAKPGSSRSGGSAFGAASGGDTGVASYYWQAQRVAAGGRFNPEALTAAHKTLPLGTRVRVTSLVSGRTVDVTINDRGPYVRGRVIDLSRRAARTIGMTGAGLARVKLEVL